MTTRTLTLAATSLAATLHAAPAPHDNTRDWAIYRGDSTGVQFSDLDQVNTDNVHRLEVAWHYHHGDPSGPSMYSNPVIVDRQLVFTTPTLGAVALDATTGTERWRFDPADHHPEKRTLRGRNRGVTYWQDDTGQHARFFVFVKDRVYAVDATTGTLVTSFADNGALDLRHHLPVPPENASVEVTTPGIVYRDTLIVGSRVPEGNDSTPGDIRAYDAKTGAFRWIFHTVPQPGELGHDTWGWEPGTVYGGANPWGGFTLDPDRGWVFCATGCAAGDFIYGGSRKGKNLFANCVLALDATTGNRVWHFQTVHHDIWDYDNPPAPVLATLPATDDTPARDVAVQMTKMGFVFVLDRDTGEPVFPVEERPVPASDVPGEQAYPTQPFPVRPPPLVRQAVYQADLTRVTPEAHAAALAEFKKRRTGPLYTPASREGTITTPGHQGGIEWGGGAFDPATGVLYVNANEAPTINQLVPVDHRATAGHPDPAVRGHALYDANCTFCHGPNRSGLPPLYPPLDHHTLTAETVRTTLRDGRGIMPAFPQFSPRQVDDLTAFLLSPPPPNQPTDTGPATNDTTAPRYLQVAPFFADNHGVPLISPPWGTLNAVDLTRGEIVWKVPLGEYPHLAAQGIRHTGAKNFGGPVLTAGGLVFIAATPDEKIRAFDKFTGTVLWEHDLPAGGYATPAIYQIDGTQYITIAAGGGGKLATPHGDSVIAFTLPTVH